MCATLQNMRTYAQHPGYDRFLLASGMVVARLPRIEAYLHVVGSQMQRNDRDWRSLDVSGTAVSCQGNTARQGNRTSHYEGGWLL
jgi:hypothetical protein